MSGLLNVYQKSLIGGFCAFGLLVMLGCDPAPPTPKDPAKKVAGGHDDHEKHGKHDDHDHDKHGKHDDHDGHEHAASGAPHKGQLQEIEGEAGHVEIVLDEATGKLTAYILDGAAKASVSVPNKDLALTFTPKAGKDGKLPDAFEDLKLEAVDAKDGKATTFAGTSAKLKGVKEFSGVIATLTIGGKEYKAIEVKFPSPHQH